MARYATSGSWNKWRGPAHRGVAAVYAAKATGRVPRHPLALSEYGGVPVLPHLIPGFSRPRACGRERDREC